jgi:hypothetical protein
MTIKLENNRPVLASNQIAARVRLAELKGWFTKELRVGEGTCVLIYDGGKSNGVVSPGAYTLQSFLGGLFSDMDKRNISAVICRTGEMPMKLVCGGILTQEKLLANIEIQLTVRFTDPPMFAMNLLGTQDDMTVEQLAASIQPILLQSIRASVAQMSITEITLPQNKDVILSALRQTAKDSLARFGLDIAGIIFVSVGSEQYDALQHKRGETFLLKEGVEIEDGKRKVEELKKRYELDAEERENDLLALSAQIEGDRKDAELTALQRRIKQRQTMREMLQQGEFDKIDSEAKMKAFLHEQDKQDLLRREEKDLLLETYRNDQADRERTRQHLVHKIDLENAADLAKLQAGIEQAQRLQALDYEAELIQKAAANIALVGDVAVQTAEQAERLRTVQRATEKSEEEHKINLRKIEDDYDVKRRREDADFEIWRKEEEIRLQAKAQDVKIDGIKAKSDIAMSSMEKMAEMDRQRRQQKIDAELKSKELDNDAEKTRLLAEKEANEKQERERAEMQRKMEAAQDKHADAFGKSASDIKEIALALAGSRGGQQAEQPKETVILVCPKCKTRNNGGAKYCGSCGEML